MSGIWTLVRLRKTTCERLKDVGVMGDSYEKVINRLLNQQTKEEEV